MYKLKVIIGFFLLALFSQSMAPAPNPPGLMTHLTSNRWRVSTVTISPVLDTGEVSISNLLTLEDSCFLDDYMVFFQDSTVWFRDDTLPCGSTFRLESRGWYFQNDSSEIFYTFNDSISVVLNLSVLNDDSLKFTEERLVGSETHTITYTYLSF